MGRLLDIEEPGDFGFDPGGPALRRSEAVFTVIAVWDDEDCEEIDVVATNEADARKTAIAELERHHYPGWTIKRVIRRTDGWMF